jgi:Gas vesicle synthesis protein GvpL/GvpF
MNAPAGRASYAYAVARPFDPAQLAGVRGVDGADVHLVRYQDLVAVVSSVPLTEFDEAALRTKLERLPWLEATARAHHAVVDVVAASSVTVPLRLATVYRADERVIEVLRQGCGRFRAALDRLADRVELGVKVYTDPQAKAPAAAPSASSPGRDYLKRRRAQHRASDDAWQRAAAIAERVDATLAGLAVDSRQRPPQRRQLSGARGENVLNAAYLVDTGRSEEFAAVARCLDAGAPGTRIELTGPWAPYSFALPDHGEPA